VACLAYLASEDPQFISRERRSMPVDTATGKERPWPQERDPQRAGGMRDMKPGQ
jgi:hypothetical protein